MLSCCSGTIKKRNLQNPVALPLLPFPGFPRPWQQRGGPGQKEEVGVGDICEYGVGGGVFCVWV